MEDDIGVSKLVELIFLKKFQVTAEMTVKDSSFPPCLLVNDFPLKLRCVIILKQAVLYEVWRKGWPNFFDEYIKNVHTFTANYLKSILSACYVEHFCLNKPFDSFICVCAMVRVSCSHISQKSGIDFNVLNSLIVLEFYERVLKNSFLRCGGFQRFVRYINEHPYLKWKMDLNDETALDDPLGYFDPSTAEKLEKEKKREMNSRSSGYARNLHLDDLESISDLMAKNVFLAASVRILEMKAEIESQLLHGGAKNLNEEAKTAEGTMETEAALKSEPLDGGAMNLNEKVKTAEGNMGTEATLKSEPLDKLPSHLRSNLDPKANHAAKQQEVIPSYESIVEAVIKYNRSKNSDLSDCDKQLLERANRILDRLQYKIKYLIEVLDEYDKE